MLANYLSVNLIKLFERKVSQLDMHGRSNNKIRETKAINDEPN